MIQIKFSNVYLFVRHSNNFSSFFFRNILHFLNDYDEDLLLLPLNLLLSSE